MLNISPSKDELKHLEKIAVAELTQRGYDKTVLFMKKAKNSSKCTKALHQNLMSEYASNFRRY
jgi:hypothetical protein